MKKRLQLGQVLAQLPGEYYYNKMIVERFLDVIAQEVMINGNTVVIYGFGKFWPSKANPNRICNFDKGRKANYRRLIKFKTSPSLKRRIYEE